MSRENKQTMSQICDEFKSKKMTQVSETLSFMIFEGTQEISE